QGRVHHGARPGRALDRRHLPARRAGPRGVQDLASPAGLAARLVAIGEAADLESMALPVELTDGQGALIRRAVTIFALSVASLGGAPDAAETRAALARDAAEREA